jgi:hypothetical protein
MGLIVAETRSSPVSPNLKSNAEEPVPDPDFANARVIAWPLIRAEYETTGISLRALAARHGLKSHGTILRRIKEENWERDVGAIAANTATDAILDHEEARAPFPPRDPNGQVHRLTAPELLALPAPPRPLAEPGAEKVRQGQRMGRMQAQQQQNELGAGATMMDVGATILHYAHIVLTSEDMLDIKRASDRLGLDEIASGGMPGMVRAALALIDGGVKLRRAGLGMAPSGLTRVVKGAQPLGGMIGDEAIPDHVAKTVSTLGLATLQTLRDTALAIAKAKDQHRNKEIDSNA